MPKTQISPRLKLTYTKTRINFATLLPKAKSPIACRNFCIDRPCSHAKIRATRRWVAAVRKGNPLKLNASRQPIEGRFNLRPLGFLDLHFLRAQRCKATFQRMKGKSPRYRPTPSLENKSKAASFNVSSQLKYFDTQPIDRDTWKTPWR